MTNQFTQEQTLQLRYPVGTKGKLNPIDAQTLTHLISRGWEPSFVVTVESVYLAGHDNLGCLVVRWGQGQSDWSGVMAEGFKAIALGSELAGIEKWFEEGRQAALKGEGDGRKCPYDDDYHWFDEHLWWNRGYKFADRSARLIVAEQLIKEMEGDRCDKEKS